MLPLTADTRESWARFAEKIGAEHICRGQPTWKNNYDSVVYDYKGTLIILDFVSDEEFSHTRLYASVSAKENFRFNIYPSNFLEKFLTYFGSQDVNIGDELFDNKFIVKTNDVNKVRLFLSNPKMRQLIWKGLPNGLHSLNFEGNLKKGKIKSISVSQRGLIKDVERLELIFQLIIVSLDQLVSLELVTSS